MLDSTLIGNKLTLIGFVLLHSRVLGCLASRRANAAYQRFTAAASIALGVEELDSGTSKVLAASQMDARSSMDGLIFALPNSALGLVIPYAPASLTFER